MSRSRYVGHHRVTVEQKSKASRIIHSKLVRRVGVPVTALFAVVFGMSSMASADPVPVSWGDTFSGLVAEHCGTSDWQDVAFPGRDKNLIFAGETIDITCPGQQSNADIAAQNTPAPPAPATPVSASCSGPATPHWWSDTQWANARIIVQVGLNKGFGKQGIIIALATAMQESSILNLANPYYPSSYNYANDGSGYDHDSLGLFQQRSSTGWGSVSYIMNPWTSTDSFYNALARFDYWDYSVSGAAQKVQGSAYPDAYAKWVNDASNMATTILCA